MFGANYLENSWRYRLGHNRAPIGNGIWGIKWSHDRWPYVTLKCQSWTRHIWMQISQKRLKIEARCQWDTNRKWHGKSNGHVKYDVMWPCKVKLVTPICLRPIISKIAVHIHFQTSVMTSRYPGVTKYHTIIVQCAPCGVSSQRITQQR